MCDKIITTSHYFYFSRSDPPVADTELTDLCERLWDLDKNRLKPDVDYKLDMQGRTKYSYDGPDRAKDPLYEFVKEDALKRDTYKGLKLIAFLVNLLKLPILLEDHN